MSLLFTRVCYHSPVSLWNRSLSLATQSLAYKKGFYIVPKKGYLACNNSGTILVPYETFLKVLYSWLCVELWGCGGRTKKEQAAKIRTEIHSELKHYEVVYSLYTKEFSNNLKATCSITNLLGSFTISIIQSSQKALE